MFFTFLDVVFSFSLGYFKTYLYLMKIRKQMLHNQDVNYFFCEMTQKFHILTNVYKMSSRENTNMQSNKI